MLIAVSVQPAGAGVPSPTAGCGTKFTPSTFTCTMSGCSPAFIRLKTYAAVFPTYWKTFSVTGTNANCWGLTAGQLPHKISYAMSVKYGWNIVNPTYYPIQATGPYPSCNFLFKNGAGATVASCTIDSSDGVPVELLEFSVGE